MSSSTSSSRAVPVPRPDWRVVLLLALTLLALEAFTRKVLFPASKDIRRFGTYGTRAARLEAAQGFRVAFVGNSATDRGVDPARFARELARVTGGPVAADKFCADGSSVVTWKAILDRFFWQHPEQPDLVVLNFYDDYLKDGAESDVGRLAHFFARPGDWGPIFRSEARGVDAEAGFLLAYASAAYAARQRIRERVLEKALPGYRDQVTRINDVNFQHERRKVREVRREGASYLALARLLQRAQETRTPLCFVAYPTCPSGESAQHYPVDPAAVRMIRGAGMYFLDLRRSAGIAPERYADSVHLDEQGKTLYTARLAGAVTPVAQLVMRASPRGDRRLVRAAADGAQP